MRRRLLAGMLVILTGCAEQPTQQSQPAALDAASAVTSSSVPACNPSAFPPVGSADGFGLTKNIQCGGAIGVSVGNAGGNNVTQVQAAITTAVGNWNAVLQENPALNLPRLVANVGGGISINFDGVGAKYCGTTGPWTSILIHLDANCNGNYVAFNHIADLLTHELGHSLGFNSSAYHKLPVGINDHCVMSLPDSPNLGTINSVPCQFELEKFYQIYGVRSTVPDNFRHNITGLSFGSSVSTLTSGQTFPVAVAALSAHRANPSLCGPGGPAARPREPHRPSTQSCGQLPATDATYSWSSSSAGIVSVSPAGPGSPNATLTAGAAGTAVITVQVTSPGPHQLAARFGEYAGETNQFSVTVQASVPTAIAITQGNGQTASVGTTLPTAPTVRVTNQAGQPVSGVSITFAVTGGNGSVSPVTVITNAAGTAATSWTLGTLAGANSLRATAAPSGIAGNPITFTATGLAGAATTMSKAAGDNQTAMVGGLTPIRPAVLVTDAYGNPISGRTVNFAIGVGGGNVIPASVVTTSAGLATVNKWFLGPVAGTNTLIVTSAGLSPGSLTFTAQGVLVVAPTAFHVTGCTTSTSNGKVYATYGTSWTAGANPAGTTSEIGESFSSNSSTATVIWPGLTGTTQNLGPYLTGVGNNSPRYFWVRHRSGSNVSGWAPLDLFPIVFDTPCGGGA